MSITCERLDNYLAGELDVNDSAAFHLHLADCAACREQVRFQEALDGLLRQATACETPTRLLTRVDEKLQASARRKRLTAMSAVALAASLVLMIVFRPSRQPTDVVHNGLMSSSESESTPQQPVATLVVDPSCDFLAVPQKSSQSNVTIFWLYPTIQTATPAITIPGSES